MTNVEIHLSEKNMSATCIEMDKYIVRPAQKEDCQAIRHLIQVQIVLLLFILGNFSD